MGEEAKTPSIRETIARRKSETVNGKVLKDIPGLGKAFIKRLTVAEMLTLPEEDERIPLVLLAAHDHNGVVLFQTAEEVKAIDSGAFNALVIACRQVNRVSVADAEKK